MRTTHDALGEMAVPDDALWGASTQRAVQNFPISGHPMPAPMIRALGLIKHAAARANEAAGLLTPDKSRRIQRHAADIAAGRHHAQFPVDVFQTGSGTSSHTNVNEVIACLASAEAPDAPRVHPNDDVNLGQSSNDVMPSALHLSVALALRDDLRPALIQLAAALEARARAFAAIVKLGRTHLMDAVPLTLGQEFGAYAAQMRKAVQRIDRAIAVLAELPVGGTAVGTGLNAGAGFGAAVCRELAAVSGLALREADNHFEAQAARDDCVEVAGQLSAVVAALTKLANDIRLLGSGPRGGLGELHLPAVQPGSSIMPGKVNPVMCEMVVQVGLHVQGLMHTVMACGREGQLELNATLPLLAYCLHEAVRCLANASRSFATRCVDGLEADAARCAALLTASLTQVTALTPWLGYDAAAAVATQALAENRSLRSIVLERALLDAVTLDRVLEPWTLCFPHAPGGAAVTPALPQHDEPTTR